MFDLPCPSKQSKAPSDELQRGYYSDLRFSVGLSFDRSDADAIRALCASAGAGEVFLWPSSTLAKLGKLKLAGCSTIENKQLHMLGYLFELFYDLMISPSANVSRSPGFESCLGIFGGA